MKESVMPSVVIAMNAKNLSRKVHVFRCGGTKVWNLFRDIFPSFLPIFSVAVSSKTDRMDTLHDDIQFEYEQVAEVEVCRIIYILIDIYYIIF